MNKQLKTDFSLETFANAKEMRSKKSTKGFVGHEFFLFLFLMVDAMGLSACDNGYFRDKGDNKEVPISSPL